MANDPRQTREPKSHAREQYGTSGDKRNEADSKGASDPIISYDQDAAAPISQKNDPLYTNGHADSKQPNDIQAQNIPN